MGLISLAGLMGCSGSGTVEPAAAGAAIAFSADLPERQAVTRSGTPLEDELPVSSKTFKVWAYKNTAYEAGSYTSYQTVMSGYTVGWTENTAYTTTTNTHDWEYILPAQPDQTIKFWDWSAKAYRFFAVASATASGIFSLDDSGTVNLDDDKFRFTLTADATMPESTPYYSRLWFSDNTTKPYGQPVTLEFIKPFAQVRFIIRYANPAADPLPLLANYNFAPTEPSACPIPQSGTVTLTFPISGTGTKETWATSDVGKPLGAFTTPYTQDDDDPADIVPGTYKWYTVMPVVGQSSYTLTVRVDGEDRTAVVPAQYMDWLPGYSYTYIFKVNEEGGVELQYVDTAYTDWLDTAEKERIVYNW